MDWGGTWLRLGLQLSFFCVWEDLGYLSNAFHFEYHSLHHGESPHRTRGDTVGGHHGDEWCGSQSPIQTSTQGAAQLLQVFGHFSNPPGIDHCSPGRPHGGFVHLCNVVQPGEKLLAAPLTSSINHYRL